MRYILAAVLLFGLASWTGGPAWALAPPKAEADQHAEKKEVASHDAKGKGHDKGHGGADSRNAFLRQLAEQGIWTVVVFLVLLFVLRRFAWGPMLEGLNKREETIQRALDEARRAQAEAQALREQLQREMSQAADKVRGILEEARRDAQHTKDEIIAEGRKEVKAEGDRKLREIELAKDQALQELWNRTADLATLVSARAIGRSLNEDDHRRLVDEALGGLSRAGNPRRNEGASP